MTTLRVRHLTRYRYDRAVTFEPHRLMIRPRDSHDLRIVESGLSIFPAADVEWSFDIFGNSVALASFRQTADFLAIESDLLIRRYGDHARIYPVAAHAAAYPFRYSEDEALGLAPFLTVACPADRASVDGWLQRAMPVFPSGTLDLLAAVSAAIYFGFTYWRRDAPGVQAPGFTIASRSGTCRDFALLFMEAVRSLGFAARFVTGYFHDPEIQNGSQPLVGEGATHAWADVFVPGAGWIEFDPTNRTIARRNLIRVAATRTPREAMPVSGSFRGGGRLLGMEVTVAVGEVTPPQPEGQ